MSKNRPPEQAAGPLRFLAPVWVMVLVALVVRLIVVRFFSADLLDPARDHYLPGLDGDHVSYAREYERIAKSLVSGQGFSSPYPYPTGPTALVGPAYAILLAGVYKIFGALTNASTFAALALNAIFSSLTCLPIYFMARRSFGTRVAIWSGWAWAFYPHAIAGCSAWIWDTILGTLLMALLVLYTLYLERPAGYLPWTGYGLLWVLGALTNANVLSTLPFFGIWILVRQWQTKTLRLGPIVAASLVFLIGVTPWVWRSSHLYGRFVAFRGNFGLEVMVGNSKDTTHPSNWDETPGSNLEQMQLFEKLGEPAYMALKQREAAEVIHDRPLWFAGQTLRRILYTWTNIWSFPPGLDFSETGLPDVLIYTVMTVFAFFGIRWALRSRLAETIPLLIPLVFFPVVYYITHQDDGRFRHPIDPVIMVFVAAGVCALWPGRAAGLGNDGAV